MIARKSRLRPRRMAFLSLLLFSYPFFSEAVTKTDGALLANYQIHFLKPPEIKNSFIHKCCPNEKVLDGAGHCVMPDRSKAQEWEGFNLETRIRRAIQDKVDSETGSEDKIAFNMRYGIPHCVTKPKQLSFSINSPSNNFSFSKSFQLISPSTDNSSFLIINSRDYCIDWLPSMDTIAVQFCEPQTCHTTPKQDYTTPLDPDENISENSSSVRQHNNSITPSLSAASSTTSASALSSPARPLCLRKCCPPSKVINMTSFQCVQHDIPWELRPLSVTSNSSPTTTMNTNSSPSTEPASWNSPHRDHTNDDDDDGSESHTIPLAVTWLTGMPNCEHYEVYSDKYDSYYINSDGVLITVEDGKASGTPPGEYCFDGVVLEDDKTEPAISRQMALVCFEEKHTDGGEGEGIIGMENAEMLSWRVVYTVLTGISCIFLFITCVVYGILWKDLNLPGWLQFAYATSLLLTFLLLTVAQLWTQQIHDISKGLCSALGYGLHFFFLSCFFWLTSMNLDLWLSFRNTVLVRGFGKGRGKRRFLEFTAFSIGFPAAITLLLLAADNCSSDVTGAKGLFCILPSSGIGEDSCVIDTRHKVVQLHYFYGFVGLLLLINLVIFVGTLISLRNRERETRIAKRQSTSNCDYDRLQLFTRLFLIMGVLWTFEVIAWIFEYLYGNEMVHKMFIFTDCLNASQGIAVFLMFVWKRQTWKQLKKKYKALVGKGHGKRPGHSRQSYAYAVSNENTTKDTSVKSSHLSSTKSSDSSQIPSTSTTFSHFEFDI